MRPLLLFDDGYILNGIAQVLFVPVVVVAAIFLLVVTFKAIRKPAPQQLQGAGRSDGGCVIALAVVLAILLGLYLWIKWMAQPYYLR
ncbi:hypothetical protein [Hymenobacter sp. DG01]|uniref:hypothetical protein n=1 Tax=Hymenobacter sp. DG01 TaxID=2584940 RepID=UPI001123B2C3|nr:hypothetical protein [Hymenobacter sp. DG01]